MVYVLRLGGEEGEEDIEIVVFFPLEWFGCLDLCVLHVGVTIGGHI